MFSFFRKSKKEPERHLHHQANGCSVEDEPAAVLTQNMCKNNDGISKQGGNATASPAVLPEIAVCEIACDDGLTAESKANIATKNDRREATMSSYAGALKKPEPKEAARHGGSSVKPCGHGTVAVSPRIPLPAGNRSNPATPPESPKFSDRRFSRSNSDNKAPDDAISVRPAPPRRHNQQRKGSLNELKTTTGTGPNAVRKLSAEPRLTNGHHGSSTELEGRNGDDHADDKKNLINQEAKFQSQLNELSKQLSQRDGEANKLRFQMDELQRDVFAKSAGMDRLQSELQAAHKESEFVKQRLRNLEEDLEQSRRKTTNLTEELNEKSDHFTQKETESNTKMIELEAVIRDLRGRIETLELQIEQLKQEKQQLEEQHRSILDEREKEKALIEVALDEALKEKDAVNKKWEQEFESLRTVNILKEQQLLDDFEWKLREVEKSCKQKLQQKDKSIDEKLQEAYKHAEEKMKLAQDMMKEVEHLRSFENEVEELRDKTQIQEKSIDLMKEQQEQMRNVEQSLKDETKKLRSLIDLEKENLQHMQRMHHQEIVDKQRWLHNTLEEKKTEIAVYWEERLLHEIGRLKYELEQIYLEEKHAAVEQVRKQKEEEFEDNKAKWERKIEECFKEIRSLKRNLQEKEQYYHEEMVAQQTITDRDILELRRLMDKIDNAHHERFEKLVTDHEKELDEINRENESKIRDMEEQYQNQLTTLRTTLELVKEQMERESQNKIETLIQQHRSELDTQWANLIHQKSEAIKLVEDEYVNKYQTLEEQFCTQQKSHEAREIELLKTIDSLKNDMESRTSTIDDLQNNVDVLEGGVQVLHQEIAHQGEQLIKNRRDADQKIRGLQDVLMKLQALQERERDEFQSQLLQQQKQSQTTIDHLQRKCITLTKLFEEIRSRYERRESRKEDLNVISDLRQIIAEQEKDMACMNEEKRYYQMQLMKLQREKDGEDSEVYDDAKEDSAASHDDEDDDDDDGEVIVVPYKAPPSYNSANTPSFPLSITGCVSIPPTIIECDDCEEE